MAAKTIDGVRAKHLRVSEQLVQIPPGVWHGFKDIGESEAIAVDVTTHPHNHKEPDEYRLPAHEDHIQYEWARKDG